MTDTASTLPVVYAAAKTPQAGAATADLVRGLGAAAQPGKELFGIEATNDGLVIFGGGELLIRNNVIVGAIGVSGGSVAEDTNVAKAGAAAIK